MVDSNVERVVDALLRAEPQQAGAEGLREPVYWERLAWPDIHALVARGTRLAILPVGAIEQHGPHLPVNTDVVIAEAVAALASAKVGVPVLPSLSYASSIGHTDLWPGTLSLSPETLIVVCREIAGWLLRSGFSKLLFVNGHFGNDAALRIAVDRLRTDHLGRLSVGTRNVWEVSREVRDFYLLDGEDIHANRAETSLMLAIAPRTVGDHRSVDDPDRTRGIVLSYPVALTSKNGVTGRPSEASSEEGLSMLEKMGCALAELVRRAVDESPPIRPAHLFPNES